MSSSRNVQRLRSACRTDWCHGDDFLSSGVYDGDCLRGARYRDKELPLLARFSLGGSCSSIPPRAPSCAPENLGYLTPQRSWTSFLILLILFSIVDFTHFGNERINRVVRDHAI